MIIMCSCSAIWVGTKNARKLWLFQSTAIWSFRFPLRTSSTRSGHRADSARATLSHESSPIAPIPPKHPGTHSFRSRETIFLSLAKMDRARERCDSRRERDRRAREHDRRARECDHRARECDRRVVEHDRRAVEHDRRAAERDHRSRNDRFASGDGVQCARESLIRSGAQMIRSRHADGSRHHRNGRTPSHCEQSNRFRSAQLTPLAPPTPHTTHSTHPAPHTAWPTTHCPCTLHAGHSRAFACSRRTNIRKRYRESLRRASAVTHRAHGIHGCRDLRERQWR